MKYAFLILFLTGCTIGSLEEEIARQDVTGKDVFYASCTKTGELVARNAWEHRLKVYRFAKDAYAICEEGTLHFPFVPKTPDNCICEITRK